MRETRTLSLTCRDLKLLNGCKNWFGNGDSFHTQAVYKTITEDAIKTHGLFVSSAEIRFTSPWKLGSKIKIIE